MVLSIELTDFTWSTDLSTIYVHVDFVINTKKSFIVRQNMTLTLIEVDADVSSLSREETSRVLSSFPKIIKAYG